MRNHLGLLLALSAALTSSAVALAPPLPLPLPEGLEGFDNSGGTIGDGIGFDHRINSIDLHGQHGRRFYHL